MIINGLIIMTLGENKNISNESGEKKNNGHKYRIKSKLLGDLLELESNVKYAWHVDWPCKARFR